jgi:Emfourin
MRIQFQMEGGIAHFPGLSQPTAIESSELPDAEADQLKQLVETVRFFELPTRASTPPQGAADYRQYTITIEEGERRHTVRLADPVEDSQLQQLLGYLQAKARARRGGGS